MEATGSKLYEPKWDAQLAVLAGKEVTAGPQNAVHARLTNIDGTGTACLVSRQTNATETYGGFALVFKDETKYKDFEWLQFITRHLVVDGVAKRGNLTMKPNTTAYQLVDSAEEITNYATFPSNSKPSNWNTCWKVDSSTKNAFFRYDFYWTISDSNKLTAILDEPSVLAGKAPKTEREKRLAFDKYQDLPDGLVNMEEELGKSEGTSRAYFSDYLVKKLDDGKHRIYARFDFSLTWNTKERKKKENFELRLLASTTTATLLECHSEALNHKTTPFWSELTPGPNPKPEPVEPWRDFRESIQ